MDLAFFRGTSMNALVYLRRPVALTLKPGDARKGELLPRLQLNGATAHCAFYVRTHPGKGNKPLHDLRIERVKGGFQGQKNTV